MVYTDVVTKKHTQVSKDTLSKLEKSKIVKIDLGCGANKHPNFFGVDVRPLPGVDLVQDLDQFPWALPDACADLVVASHLIEHIDPTKFGFIKFMNEVWRILKPDGEFAFVTPYAGSPGYWQDPTHVNPVSHRTLWYFDPLHESQYYRIYTPKPWKIKASNHNPVGNLEGVLIKRREDPSYGKTQG